MADIAAGEVIKDERHFITQAETGLGTQDQTLQTDWIYRLQVPVNQEIILKPEHKFGIYLKRLNSPVDGAFSKDDTAYVWECLDVNDAGANDFDLMPAVEVVTVDGFLFGYRFPFTCLRITIGTAGVGAGSEVSWNYYNGSAWTPVPGLTDGTEHLIATAGTNNVTWRYPSDWAQNAVNGMTLYWLNCICTTANFTTQPIGTQAWIGGAQEMDNPDIVEIQIRNAGQTKIEKILTCMYEQCKEITEVNKMMTLSLEEEYRVKGGQWIYIVPQCNGGLIDVSECYFNLECDRQRATMYARV